MGQFADLLRDLIVTLIEIVKHFFGGKKLMSYLENGGKKYTYLPIDVTRREFLQRKSESLGQLKFIPECCFFL